MRFISQISEQKHKDFVTCIGWSNSEEVYSCGDDHVMLKWNLITGETSKVAELPVDLFPTDLHWFPRTSSSSKKQAFDILLLTSADGKLHLVNKTGRFEKSVEAHKGAALCARWSYDGSGLLTAGEDGQVKIWSRSGMLRSTVVQTNIPIYSAAWGPDSNQVLYTFDKMLVIKPLAPNSKPIKWKAHDGVILKVSWNQSNNLIVSGGEDCKYKVWDSYGRQLYSSMVHDHPITSLAWSPIGDLFAVGSFNTLRLCDKTGWSHSLEKPNTGSILNLSWSSDSTQIAGACANGHIIFSHIVDRNLKWKGYEATVTGRKTIKIHNVLNDSQENLELHNRVIQVAMGYNHLVVVSSTQCHIFSTSNWNTPVIFDLKEGSASLLLLSERHFLLVDSSNLSLYTYQGRLISSLKWPSLQSETLNETQISISPDTVVIRDQNDNKLVRLFEVGSSRSMAEASSISHTMGISELGLNQIGSAAERQIAIVDKNRDLYLAYVRGSSSFSRKLQKLAPMIQSISWNTESNMLAGVQDIDITVWYYPPVLFVDKRLLKKTTMVEESSEYGKNPVISSFIGNDMEVRYSDGSLITVSVSPFPAVLHGFASSAKWEDSLRLCQLVKDTSLWACLAAMAIQAKNLNVAEEAYGAIDELDKVDYIQHIKSIGHRGAQLAEIALLGGNLHEAENILLQNGLIFRAIVMNLDAYQWNRALELAIKHKTNVDTVLYHRSKYLEAFDKQENNEKFLKLKDEVEIDEAKILKKMEIEGDMERK